MQKKKKEKVGIVPVWFLIVFKWYSSSFMLLLEPRCEPLTTKVIHLGLKIMFVLKRREGSRVECHLGCLYLFLGSENEKIDHC